MMTRRAVPVLAAAIVLASCASGSGETGSDVALSAATTLPETTTSAQSPPTTTNASSEDVVESDPDETATTEPADAATAAATGGDAGAAEAQTRVVETEFGDFEVPAAASRVIVRGRASIHRSQDSGGSSHR